MTRKWKQVLCLSFALLGLSLAECPPGTYRAKNGSCISCIEGVSYTDSYDLDVCFSCRDCESAGQVEVSPCTLNKNTKCECKAGECPDKDSPEHCVPCERDKLGLRLGLGLGLPGLLVVVLLVYICICHYKKNKSQAFLDSLRKLRYSFLARCIRHPRTASEIRQNDLNERENQTKIGSYDEGEGHDVCLPDTVDRELELIIQEQAPLTAGTVQAQGDTEQVPTGAGQSQERRKRLVPVEGTNGAESLRLFFNDIPSIVSIHCLKPVMRRLGLTENEISAAEWECPKIHEQMYKMLMIWQEKQGMEASVNTLLDALEAQGQRGTKEIIQGRLVNSGKFIYEDNGAGSVVSHEEETMKLEDLPLLPYDLERKEQVGSSLGESISTSAALEETAISMHTTLDSSNSSG